MFNVGDEVIYDPCHDGIRKRGVVAFICTAGKYPVEADFEDGSTVCFTKDGKKYDDDDEPSLFCMQKGDMFKVGDKVQYDGDMGYVESINDVSAGRHYPIKVSVDARYYEWFTVDGKNDVDDEVASLIRVSVGDSVNHPPHYTTGDIESIDAMQAFMGDEKFVSGCVMTAFKYLWRWDKKDTPAENLKKARWYIDKALSIIDGE